MGAWARSWFDVALKRSTHIVYGQLLLTSLNQKVRIQASIAHNLTDTGEDSKLVHRRKRPKVDTLFSSLFSDAFERRV